MSGIGINKGWYPNLCDAKNLHLEKMRKTRWNINRLESSHFINGINVIDWLGSSSPETYVTSKNDQKKNDSRNIDNKKKENSTLKFFN